MNKKLISALVLAGMMMGANAFASFARQTVMGQGGANVISDGSFYYDSIYNVFYNPAYINDMKNYVIVEKNAADAASMGVATSMSGFNLGVYMNRQNAFGPALTGEVDADHAIDVILGGDQGVKWGLGLTYASNDSGFDGKNSDLVARVGMSMNGFDPFLSFNAMGKQKTGATTEEKHKGFNAGLRYHYGEWTPYAAYSNSKNEVAAADEELTTWLVGIGRETKLAEGARLAYAVWHQRGNGKSAGVENKKQNVTPLNVSVEADATTWLTVRAGFQHTLLGSHTYGPLTVGRIGGTFHMGKVDADFAFGNQSTSSTTPATVDSSNVGFDSGTFSTVAVRYSW